MIIETAASINSTPALVPALSGAKRRFVDMKSARAVNIWQRKSPTTEEDEEKAQNDYEEAAKQCIKAKYGFHKKLDQHVLYIEMEAPTMDEEKAKEAFTHRLRLKVGCWVVCVKC
jgi:kynurenine formamidase